MKTDVYTQLRSLAASAAAGAAVAMLYDALVLLPGRRPAIKRILTALWLLASSLVLFVVFLRTGEGVRPALLCTAGAGFFVCRYAVRPIEFDAIKFIKQFLHRS